eukprot:49529_1
MTLYQIYFALCFSCLNNVVYSCQKAQDSLTHQMCYPKGAMNSTTLLRHYNATINAFSPLSNYSYGFTLECEESAQSPSSISQYSSCFTCCSRTITYHVDCIEHADCNEHKHWALLYNINNNIMTFASDLQTQSLPAPLTYIFYASTKSSFTSSSCTRFPRICQYPLA